MIVDLELRQVELLDLPEVVAQWTVFSDSDDLVRVKWHKMLESQMVFRWSAF